MERKEVKILEGMYVPYYPGNHSDPGGRNSNPRNALKQLDENSGYEGLLISEITYDLAKGEFYRTQLTPHKRGKLPNMVLWNYALLHKDVDPEEAVKYVYGHYFMDAFQSLSEDKEVIGLVAQKFDVAPNGSVIRKHKPIILKGYGQPCEEGEISLPAGIQTGRRSK